MAIQDEQTQGVTYEQVLFSKAELLKRLGDLHVREGMPEMARQFYMQALGLYNDVQAEITLKRGTGQQRSRDDAAVGFFEGPTDLAERSEEILEELYAKKFSTPPQE